MGDTIPLPEEVWYSQVPQNLPEGYLCHALGIIMEGIKKQKWKHGEDEEGEQNPNSWFKYLHCNNQNRSFFKHGLESHLCIFRFLAH